MAEMQGTIEDVRMRKLNDDRQLYVVKMNGKDLSTFKREVAASAKSYINQQVKVSYETRQNGDYTNHWINSVEPMSSGGDFKHDVDQRQIDIRRAVVLKAAIDMLPLFPENAQHWNTVMEIMPGIYDFMYGSEGNWDTSQSTAGNVAVEDVPF
jgi:hypothetical protein